MLIQQITKNLKDLGFYIAEKPYELNIVGIRSNTTKANSFDDQMYAFWKDNAGRWQIRQWPCTTDPGTYWLRSPMNPQGTAMLKGNMQFRNAYGIGLHRGKYKALVQMHKPVTVIRDYNRDDTLDFGNGREATGMFGINIHRANSSGTTQKVDKHSAGCQVFANASDFAEFMSLCEKHKELHGNSFSYTLLDARAAQRAQNRGKIWVLAGLFGVSTLLGLLMASQN